MQSPPRVKPAQIPAHETADPVAIVGQRAQTLAVTRWRIQLLVLAIVLGFLVIALRLWSLGSAEVNSHARGNALNAALASRPVVYDRNGIIMAIDIRVPSLFAEPRRIVDVEEAAQAVQTVLPQLELAWLRKRLSGDSGFAWIARELTPKIQTDLMRLGIPGLDFVTETKRFYPAYRQAAHVMGAANIDNIGIAGIEHYIDQSRDVVLLQELGLARAANLEPVSLSLDMRVQNILHNQLADALIRYQAIAGAGAIIDVQSGEIIALVSLPDFDPNHPSQMLEAGRFNRVTAAKFEPASIFKPLTIAAALDAGAVTLHDHVDARTPVRFGRHSISDYYGKYRHLTVPEVLVHSSNIGTVRIAERLGAENFREFLTRIGMDVPPVIELPEVTAPVVPKAFSAVTAATVSFGHGLSVTPLQMLTATAALVNGGHLPTPTLIANAGDNTTEMKRVIKNYTSLQMRYLLRLNALDGSARRANKLAEGYRLGGKTGTAEKVVAGRYSSEKVTTFFSSAFPLDAPRYAMLIMIDEPKREQPGSGRTAAYNAGDVTGRVVQRIAPMLGIVPSKWTNVPSALFEG